MAVVTLKRVNALKAAARSVARGRGTIQGRRCSFPSHSKSRCILPKAMSDTPGDNSTGRWVRWFEHFWNVGLDCGGCWTIHKVERPAALSAFTLATQEPTSVQRALLPTSRRRSGFNLTFTSIWTCCHFQQGQFPYWKKSFLWVKSQQLHLFKFPHWSC